jgi:hypothetical protein
MYDTILIAILISVIVLTFFAIGCIFGWKVHIFWLNKSNNEELAKKESEADSTYRTTNGKFYTHKIVNDED